MARAESGFILQSDNHLSIDDLSSVYPTASFSLLPIGFTQCDKPLHDRHCRRVNNASDPLLIDTFDLRAEGQADPQTHSLPQSSRSVQKPESV
jgi:hypothetical protein